MSDVQAGEPRVGWWRRQWFGVLLTLLVCVVLAAVANRQLPKRYSLDVVLQADTPAGSSAQLYFSQDGVNFFPRNTVRMVQRLEAGRQSLVARIHSRKPVKALRLDPTDKPGPLV